MNKKYKNILTHHWLKTSAEKSFHAYSSVPAGAMSVCGRGPIIKSPVDMDIPGDLSPCCLSCFKELYGFDPYAIPAEK